MEVKQYITYSENLYGISCGVCVTPKLLSFISSHSIMSLSLPVAFDLFSVYSVVEQELNLSRDIFVNSY